MSDIWSKEYNSKYDIDAQSDGFLQDQSEFSWICPECGAKATSQFDKSILPMLHYSDHPDCLKSTKEKEALEKEIVEREKRDYLCSVCGFVAYGYERSKLHQMKHSGEEAEQRKESQKQTEQFELTQSMMVLATIRAGAKTWSQIKQQYELLFEKSLSDPSLKRAIDKLLSDKKVAKTEQGEYLIV